MIEYKAKENKGKQGLIQKTDIKPYNNQNIREKKWIKTKINQSYLNKLTQELIKESKP